MRFIISFTFLKLLLLFCIYTSTLDLFSQEREVDSLKKYSDRELTDKHNKLLHSDIHKATIYANQLYKNAISNNNQLQLHRALKRKAIIESMFGNYEDAHKYVDEAKKIAIEKLKDSHLEFTCVYFKGKIFYESGKYEEAFEHYTAALNFYSTNNKFMAYVTSHAIALIKNALGDQKGAIKILKKNYKAYQEANEKESKNFSPSFKVNTLLAICDTYIRFAVDNKDVIEKKTYLDSALAYNEFGLKVANRKGNNQLVALFILEKGIINTELGNYKEAIKLINTSSEIIIKESIEGWLPLLFFYKGLSYHKLGSDNEAIRFLKKSDSVSQKNAVNYPVLQRTYYLLSKIYKKRNDIDNKLKYLDLYMENDQINERITGTVRSDIHEKYDIMLLNDEIKQLTGETEEKGANYTIALIIIGMLIITFVILISYNKKKHRKNQAKFSILLKELNIKKEIDTISKGRKSKSALTIDEEKVEQIITELDKFEQKKQFLNVNCNLAFVAKKTKTNQKYLSKVIHLEKGLNFVQYITNLRIEYAIKRLKEDRKFRNYNIKSIALECGYKSSESFSKAFKKRTQIYPSFYIKKLNDEY